MDLDKLVTERPALTLIVSSLICLLLGAYARDWLDGIRKFVRKRLSSRSEKQALARIEQLEKEIKEREKYTSNPQTYNYFVWHKIFAILSKIIFSLSIFAATFTTPFVAIMMYPTGTQALPLETQDRVVTIYYLIPYVIFILAFFETRIIVSFLKDIKDFDTYKNKVLAEIDSLKKKYPASVQIQ